MLVRIVTSIVALAVFAAVIIAPPIVFKCAMGIIILAMIYECTHIMTKSASVKAVCYISAALIAFGAVFAKILPPVIVSVMLFMVLTVITHGKIDHKEVFAAGFMTLYIAVFMSCVTLLGARYGVSAMLLVFICAWSTDTGAYFAGSFFGKHKLIPHVSPKKTVEGSIGGIVTAMLACMIYMLIVNKTGGHIKTLSGFDGFAKIGAVGIITSVISQFGDLAASAVKRDCNVKDYGKIFPGHGGFMDRFDSVIIAAPVVYYILQLM